MFLHAVPPGNKVQGMCMCENSFCFAISLSTNESTIQVGPSQDAAQSTTYLTGWWEQASLWTTANYGCVDTKITVISPGSVMWDMTNKAALILYI